MIRISPNDTPREIAERLVTRPNYTTTVYVFGECLSYLSESRAIEVRDTFRRELERVIEEARKR